MGKYCKAYPLDRLRAFPGWTERAENARTDTRHVDGAEREVVRALTGEDVVYVQENYTVTDGIFLDEHILFGDVTPAWKAFCRETLQFEVPAYDAFEITGPAEETPT